MCCISTLAIRHETSWVFNSQSCFLVWSLGWLKGSEKKQAGYLKFARIKSSPQTVHAWTVVIGLWFQCLYMLVGSLPRTEWTEWTKWTEHPVVTERKCPVARGFEADVWIGTCLHRRVANWGKVFPDRGPPHGFGSWLWNLMISSHWHGRKGVESCGGRGRVESLPTWWYAVSVLKATLFTSALDALLLTS